MPFIKNPIDPNEPVCKNIRTRANYVPALRNDTFMEMQDPYVPYTCVKTLEVIGPDDSPVCPEDCGRKRICYEPPVASVVV